MKKILKIRAFGKALRRSFCFSIKLKTNFWRYLYLFIPFTSSLKNYNFNFTNINQVPFTSHRKIMIPILPIQTKFISKNHNFNFIKINSIKRLRFLSFSYKNSKISSFFKNLCLSSSFSLNSHRRREPVFSFFIFGKFHLPFSFLFFQFQINNLLYKNLIFILIVIIYIFLF